MSDLIDIDIVERLKRKEMQKFLKRLKKLLNEPHANAFLHTNSFWSCFRIPMLIKILIDFKTLSLASYLPARANTPVRQLKYICKIS